MSTLLYHYHCGHYLFAHENVHQWSTKLLKTKTQPSIDPIPILLNNGLPTFRDSGYSRSRTQEIDKVA